MFDFAPKIRRALSPISHTIRLKLVAGLVFALLVGALYQASPRLSPEGEKAFRLLQRTEIFCGPRVGIGGALPDTVQALRQLYWEEPADAAFKKLLMTATMAGKLYALCGLYYTDYKTFQREVQRFREGKSEVETFQGCRMGRESVAELVETKSVYSEPVRLSGPEETLNDWTARNRKGERQGYQIDIIGGGWSEWLMRYLNDDSLISARPRPKYIVATESLIRRPPGFYGLIRIVQTGISNVFSKGTSDGVSSSREYNVR